MNYDKERRLLRDRYGINTNVKSKYWTYDALECYSRFCHCGGCRLQQLVTSQKCRLNLAVSKMLDTIGIPTKECCERVGFDYERLKTW